MELCPDVPGTTVERAPRRDYRGAAGFAVSVRSLPARTTSILAFSGLSPKAIRMLSALAILSPFTDAAQKELDTELRRMLAPLLKAMQDPDPEVRRRAREAILGLVPNCRAALETSRICSRQP